jgi:hypothetical protein
MLLLLLWLWWLLLLLLLLLVVRLMLLPDIQAIIPRGLTSRPKCPDVGGERAEAMTAAPTRHQDPINKPHEEAGAQNNAHTEAHNRARAEAASPAEPA